MHGPLQCLHGAAHMTCGLRFSPVRDAPGPAGAGCARATTLAGHGVMAACAKPRQGHFRISWSGSVSRGYELCSTRQIHAAETADLVTVGSSSSCCVAESWRPRCSPQGEKGTEPGTHLCGTKPIQCHQRHAVMACARCRHAWRCSSNVRTGSAPTQEETPNLSWDPCSPRPARSMHSLPLASRLPCNDVRQHYKPF